MIQTILNNFTGTGQSTGVRMPIDRLTLFLILSYGATPTISLQLEGSGETGFEQGLWAPPSSASYLGLPTIDASDAANTPTTNAVSHTYTTGSPIILMLLRPQLHLEWYRLNVTANTNVTITRAILCGLEK